MAVKQVLVQEFKLIKQGAFLDRNVNFPTRSNFVNKSLWNFEGKIIQAHFYSVAAGCSASGKNPLISLTIF